VIHATVVTITAHHNVPALPAPSNHPAEDFSGKITLIILLVVQSANMQLVWWKLQTDVYASWGRIDSIFYIQELKF
jgi:hypothetical protein